MSPSVLQYGAIGIGLAVLAYTAAALKQELARSKPRPEGRNLILMFMAFSLVAFAIATYIELTKQRMSVEHQRQIDDVEHQKQMDKIGRLVSALDANLGGKYQTAVTEIPDITIRKNLEYFEDALCIDIRKLKGEIFRSEESQCKLSTEP
jgi:hypothetical protein